MPEIAEMQDWRNDLIRKHPQQIAAMADYDADTIDEPFDETGLLVAIPNGYVDLGYINTDGISESRDVSSDDVESVQSTEPTRSDISSDVLTFQIVFQQTSAFTLAIQYGQPFAGLPTLGKPVNFSRAVAGDQPYRRLLILTQDGVGNQAFYRVQFAPRVRVTDFGDRSLQRSDEEQHDFTFTCYYDRMYGTSAREWMDGPGYRALDVSTGGASTLSAPTGGSSGSGSGTATTASSAK